jgi:hypothetical protein
MDSFPSNTKLKAVQRFANLAYWERIWIFQENVLAKKLLLTCDGESLDVDRLVEITAILALPQMFGQDKATEKRIKPDFIPLDVWCSHCFASISHPTLPWNLRRRVALSLSHHDVDLSMVHHSSNVLKATDPRDQVYGFLGISGLELVVDYNKSEVQVNNDFVGALLQRVTLRCGHHDPSISMRCDFLRFAGLGTWPNESGAFSWTPKFANRATTHTALKFGDYTRRIGIVSQSDHRPTLHQGSLCMSGIRLQKVEHTAEIFAHIPSHQRDHSEPKESKELVYQFDYTWEFLKMIRDVRLKAETYITGIPILQALFRLLTGQDTPVDGAMILDAVAFVRVLSNDLETPAKNY